MSTGPLCTGCGHPIRFSDNEAGRCEKTVNEEGHFCDHICSHPFEPIPASHDPHQPPLRFCVRCRQPIDPKRVMRGSSFCGTLCRREDSKERRAFKASKACRLCGRKARPKPRDATQEARATDAQPELALN